MNNVILIGNLTKDIELRYTNSNIAVASGTIAVRRKFKNKDGEYETDFINFVAWKKTAELLSKYLQKGDKVGLGGSIQTRNYETENGKRYVTEILVNDIEFLQNKRESQNNQQQNNRQTENEAFYNQAKANSEDTTLDLSDDDLPF